MTGDESTHRTLCSSLHWKMSFSAPLEAIGPIATPTTQPLQALLALVTPVGRHSDLPPGPLMHRDSAGPGLPNTLFPLPDTFFCSLQPSPLQKENESLANCSQALRLCCKPVSWQGSSPSTTPKMALKHTSPWPPPPPCLTAHSTSVSRTSLVAACT